MSKRGKHILCFMALCTRVVILFMEAFSFSKKENAETTETTSISNTHGAADIILSWENTSSWSETTTNIINSSPISANYDKNLSTPSPTNKSKPNSTNKVEPSIELESVNMEKISLDTLSSNIANKTETLELLYKKTNDEKVLKVLIDNLLQDYQFEKVRWYLANIDIFSSSAIDKQSYIYTYINTLSITDPNSMNNFINFIEQMKSKNLISSDEYLFYKWLQKVWDKDYDVAIETFKQITSPAYSWFTKQLESAVSNFKSQKWMPSYYQDALVSLTALKNWYFSIANKLAVYSILEDNDYILPYQVLAYSNFLTKNWDKAISYFFNLSSLDIENKNKYDFYLWISYYRQWEYEKSLTTLYQLVNDSTYKTDVYRYLLLDYEQLGQTEKMVQIWQKLLWEYNLSQSDFKYFYDVVFFKPFSKWEKSVVYENYRQISYDMVTICYDKFGYKNDTCIYGEVGFSISNWLRNSVEENLLYLAQNYPQANIFQALWDYYKNNNEKDKAKSNYIKAISLSEDSTQKSNIQNVLLKLMD